MKYRFLFLLFGLTYQSSINAQNLTDGKIYALIIGISEYQDEQIKDLNFAHRDAEIFAEYLMSKAGGAVPKENIKLLTNENATISQIYLAKQWLEDKAQKDDLVFFYFSGHGDVESSLYKLGFLLAHDTPHKNYLNNAVRIEDFNIMANTLSIKKEAKVILITDACHSGKLAGSDNRGKALVGEQLSTVSNNEIRIASCEAEQLSQEDIAWGGGRGAFSYYLINGLKGMADQGGDDSDGIVTLNELKEYLEDKVEDTVFKLKQEDQTPVVQGKKRALMALVDDDTRQLVQNEMSTERGITGSGSSRSINTFQTPQDLYFSKLSGEDFSNTLSVEAWSAISPTKIAEIILTRFPYDGLMSENIDSTTYQTWKSNILSNKELRKEFEQRLASFFHDKVQKAINSYLVGDKDELNRRQYYDAQPDEFDKLATMLEKAMTLIDDSNYLHNMMKAKSHYFKGIASRIRISQGLNKDSLLSIALKEQLAALAIDDRAGYVHNELGILYKMNKEYKSAEKEYKIAMELVPKWALPVSNMSNLKYTIGAYKEGMLLGQQAVALQDDYALAYVNLGKNAIMLKNYLLAEESFLKSAILNDKHFSPYEQLGHLYSKITDYKKAQYCFIESAKRLTGFAPELFDDDGDGVIDLVDGELSQDNYPPPCTIKDNKLGKKDHMAMMVIGGEAFFQKDFETAQKYITKSIKIDPQSPIGYYYLGKIAWQNAEWTKAEYLFNTAKDNYLDQERFFDYADEQASSQKYLKCQTLPRYQNLHYNDEDIYYLLGDIYTITSNYNQAELQYKLLIEKSPEKTINHKLLWELYEKQGQYENAEITIHNFGSYGTKQSYTQELISFYLRQIENDNNITHYSYKAANILYDQLNHIDYFDLSFIESDELLFTPNNNEQGVLIMGSVLESESNLVPGTFKQINFATPVDTPAVESIKLFKAILPKVDIIKKAEILHKLGDLYNLKNDYHASKSYYAQSLEIASQNASARKKLIRHYLLDRAYSDAYKNLEYLYKRHQINAKELLIYSDFTIHLGDYTRSDSILTYATTLFPIEHADLLEQSAKRSLFSNDHKVAIDRYNGLILKGINVANNNYTLTKLYAVKGNNRKALKHLKKAIDNGFAYQWVLDKDEDLNAIRDDSKYIKLRNKLPNSNI